MHVAKIESAVVARLFILAGNARFTIASCSTGKRFTYRVSESDDGKVHFLSVLTGPDNSRDYTYAGTIRNGLYKHGHKSRIGEEASSIVAFVWFWKNLMQNHLSPNVEMWHEGRCGRCARPLTDPTSISLGFGPECATKVPDLSLGTL